MYQCCSDYAVRSLRNSSETPEDRGKEKHQSRLGWGRMEMAFAVMRNSPLVELSSSTFDLCCMLDFYIRFYLKKDLCGTMNIIIIINIIFNNPNDLNIFINIINILIIKRT